MLYESLSQPKVFLLLCLVGFLSGFIFDAKNILTLSCKKNKILTQIVLFFAIAFLLLSFYIINLKINYGQFRIFAVTGFFLAFSIERFFVVNFVANKTSQWYNKIKENRRAKKERKLAKKL